MSDKTLNDALEKLVEERDALSRAYDRMQDKRNRALDQRDEIAALVDELRQDCKQLQKERDEAQAAIAAAEFDRDWFRAQRDDWKRDAELSAAQADAAYVERDKANREAARHSQEAEVAHSKLDRLRAGQDRWERVREAEVDERIEAWHEVSSHPFFAKCFDSDDSLLNAMIATLDRLSRRPVMADQRPEPTRLTVHDLNVAPVGSWLVWCSDVVRSTMVKTGWATWALRGSPGFEYTSEELISQGWDTARLETGGK